MFEEKTDKPKVRVLRKITKQRLKYIGIYYLKRFDSSVENLRGVLKRRVNDYAYQNKEFDKGPALQWVEEVLAEFQNYGYLDDERYASIKIRGYLGAGKSARYIMGKMREKGIDEELVRKFLGESEYDAFASALRLAKKKKIGPFRHDEVRAEFKQKDMAALVRAGFDYDVVMQIIDFDVDKLDGMW